MTTRMMKRENLEPPFNQASAASIFFTISMAEFQRPKFYSSLSNNEVPDSKTLRQSIINNTHLLDWFFTVRVKAFVKNLLCEQMGAGWSWYKFEFALMRGFIHSHGLAKLKSDPGLCTLSQVA